MNRRLGWSALGVLVAVVVFAVTNPSEEQHKERLHGWLSERPEDFWAAVGLSVADSLGISPFKYRSWLLFSVLQMEGDTVTLGFLNNVFILED